MKLSLPSLLPFAALAMGFVSLIGAPKLGAQTTFLANGLSGSVAGVSTFTGAVGLLYNNTGPSSNNITGQTFGNSFDIHHDVGPGTADTAFIIGGVFGGSPITAGTNLAISYNFSLAKNAFVDGDVNWFLKFSDSVNNPGLSVGGASLIASGTLSGAGATSSAFSGSGSYNFTSGVTSGDTFRAFIEVVYSGSIAMQPPTVTGTMNNTGFGGEGITIAAIPEPSTYGVLFGLGALGLAVYRRRQTV
jgi:hypothetical protein